LKICASIAPPSQSPETLEVILPKNDGKEYIMRKKYVTIILFFFCSIVIGQTRIIDELDNGKFIIENNKKFGISKDSINGVFKFDTICKSKRGDYLFTRTNNFWGVTNQDGKIIIPNLYQNINTACCYEKLNRKDNFIVKKNNKVGVLKFNNKVLIPLIYDKITNWVEYGPKAHYVSKDNKIGLIKHNGKIMIPIIYDSLHYYNDKIIKGKINNKLGILNSKNQVILPFEYDALIVDYDIYDLKTENHIDKFVVKKNNIWYFINYDGNILKKDVLNIEIDKEYGTFEINNYDFEYIGKLLNKKIKNYF